MASATDDDGADGRRASSSRHPLATPPLMLVPSPGGSTSTQLLGRTLGFGLSGAASPTRDSPLPNLV